MSVLYNAAAPGRCAVIELTPDNAGFNNGTYFTFVPTDSESHISFAQLNVCGSPRDILKILTRRCFLRGWERGVMIEVYVSREMPADGSISLALAQCGATFYGDNQKVVDFQ